MSSTGQGCGRTNLEIGLDLWSLLLHNQAGVLGWVSKGRQLDQLEGMGQGHTVT